METVVAVLEVAAVLAAAVGLGLVAAAVVGGMLGAGTGLLAVAAVFLAASEVGHRAARPRTPAGNRAVR